MICLWRWTSFTQVADLVVNAEILGIWYIGMPFSNVVLTRFSLSAVSKFIGPPSIVSATSLITPIELRNQATLVQLMFVCVCTFPVQFQLNITGIISMYVMGLRIHSDCALNERTMLNTM